MPEEGPVQLPTPLPPKIVGKRQRQRLIPEGGGLIMIGSMDTFYGMVLHARCQPLAWSLPMNMGQ